MISYGDKFIDFCKKKKLGKWNFDFKTFKNSYEFTVDEFHKIIDFDIVFNGQKGGLILGNLHVHGGIHLIQPDLETGILKYSGEMEGWEYLSSPLKSETHGKDLEKINKMGIGHKNEELIKFTIPNNCRVIDTFNEPIPVVFLSGYSQFIVNRFSTRNYINEILEIELKNAR
jgi:hypothetical protein